MKKTKNPMRPSMPVNPKPVWIVVQLVNNRLLNCELDEYNPPKKIGFLTYQLEVPTNSDDTHNAMESRIRAFTKRFLLENQFQTAVVNRLNNRVVLSEEISVGSKP